PHRERGPEGPGPATRPACSRGAAAGVLRQRPRQPASLPPRPRSLRPTVPGRRDRHRSRRPQPPPSRPPPQLHRRDHARLVPRWPGRPRPPAAAVDLPGTHRPRLDLLVSAGRPRTARPGRRPAGKSPGRPAMSALAPILQGLFTDRLIRQRQASDHTITAYRNTFRLLLRFAWQQTGRQPAQLTLDDLDAPLIGAFLQHLETGRGNSVTTRNARLAAIHSLFRYAALQAPDHPALIQRGLPIPTTASPPDRPRGPRAASLPADRTPAPVAAPDQSAWHGRRDHTLLALAGQTGLRVSELTGTKIRDIHLGRGPHVRCHGKGRKDRITPLTSHTVTTLRAWLTERRGAPDDPLFPSRRGTPLSTDAVERLGAKHATTPAPTCTSLQIKRVTPPTLRHSAAMALLHAGVDLSVIALWLGHESSETSMIYLHADMTLKERALARIAPPSTTPGRYTAPDTILAFLDSL